ncbi:MAG: tRNA 2-selenouridine(34) synthase MnmH [Ferruginibacter sp.]|nr:tRNA 2-selenouridine(34) synthase MnmH [Cytophagales bacterium]
MIPSLPVPDFLEQARVLPVIDVRSPGEFAQGHVPGAVNIPLFSDEERAKVGTRYKQVSKDSAIVLGLEIVGPKLADFAKRSRKVASNGAVLVHCWRGGMRSGSFAWLLTTTGLRVATLQKGYKAYRNEVLQRFNQPLPLLVLGGKTGSGKTDILKELAALGEQVLDLEGLAHHKGSSFGALGQPVQPTTEQFENGLHRAWSELDPGRRVWVEDESKTIGSVTLPPALWTQMRAAPVAFVDVPQSQRVGRLVKEYAHFEPASLKAATQRIEKRLGGLNFQRAMEALQAGEYARVAEITLDYYDRAYLYGLSQRNPETVFQLSLAGDHPAESARLLVEWATAGKPRALLPTPPR